MKKYRLIVNDHDLIPDIAKEYFLKGIDGYSYLLVDRESPVEFWKYCYGDSHPWKEYAAHDHFIARIGRREAANILKSVRSWNCEFKRRQKIKNAADEAKRVQFVNWLESLPEKIFGYTRKGFLLVDYHGNEVFDLHAFYPGSVESIESRIEELFNDGYDPGA